MKTNLFLALIVASQLFASQAWSAWGTTYSAVPLGKNCYFNDSNGYRWDVKYVTTNSGGEFAEITADNPEQTRWVLSIHMKYSIFEAFVDDLANTHFLYNSFQENHIKLQENGNTIYQGPCMLSE